MELNNLLKSMNNAGPVPKEEQVSETVRRCKNAFFLKEQDKLLTYWEFLWMQLQYTRKRWWIVQAALLVFSCQIIPLIEDNHTQLRSIGVIGCMFVVLMIPELWRNKETDSVQVEAACLYSLRQVYSARITLFGTVDITFLTLFCFGLGRMGFSFMEVISQFLLPVTVTACICFALLCGKNNWGEVVSLNACLIFGCVWWLILMNERIYTMIVPAMWVALFAGALGFLALAIQKTVCTTNQYWEARLT